MKPEATLQARILRRLGSLPMVRLFRNTVGVGWVGRVGSRLGHNVVLENARRQTFGLAVGSGDLIGWRTFTVTEADVGRKVAQFVSIEVKVGALLTEEQANWLRVVTEAGGAACVAHSVDEALAAVGQTNSTENP